MDTDRIRAFCIALTLGKFIVMLFTANRFWSPLTLAPKAWTT